MNAAFTPIKSSMVNDSEIKGWVNIDKNRVNFICIGLVYANASWDVLFDIFRGLCQLKHCFVSHEKNSDSFKQNNITLK